MLYITRLLINLLVVNLFCVFFISPSLCVTLNMSQTRGACGHIKGVFDTHVTCLSCLGCSFDKQCDVCDKWTAETWKFVRARRTHKSRKSKISISSPSSSSDHARPGSVRPGRSKIRLADFVIPRRQSPSPPSVSRRSSQTSVRHSRSTNRSEVKRRRVYVPSSSESESDVPVQINQFDSDDDRVFIINRLPIETIV